MIQMAEYIYFKKKRGFNITFCRMVVYLKVNIQGKGGYFEDDRRSFKKHISGGVIK